nr:ABC transporter substrate-binding protein [Pararoseomonas indoligenes]
MTAPRIGAAQGSSVLKFAPQSDLPTLDPIWTTAYVTRNHALLVFDTLYGQDSAYKTTPQMVEGHSVEADGRQWRLTLRPGLRWHDGERVLARDCVASIRRWGQRDNFGRLLLAATDELSAADDRTILFRLKRPFPQLPEALGKATNNLCVMMPERLARTDPFTPVTEMVGSGPFRFKADERVPGALTVYERFAAYEPRQDGKADWTSGPKVVHFDRVEWRILPDAATAAAALRQGEIDWWELPAPDLLPLLRRDRRLAIQVQDPTGYIGCMRFNHLHPPFDNPSIRRALIGAVSQADFMEAAVGSDRSMWKDGVGFFCPGTPMASGSGIQALTGPRDLERARQAIRAAGYDGKKVVLLGATDVPVLNAVSEVTADLLRQLGFNVDYQVSDWATVAQRRAKKDPPDKGGWNLLSNFTGGLDQSTPMTHTYLFSNEAAAAPGWPSSPQIEELRMRWLDAPDEGAQKRVAEELQLRAFLDVPYIPLGQYLYATAYRRDLSGVMSGFPVFWNLRNG